jgi:hypothetical protein
VAASGKAPPRPKKNTQDGDIVPSSSNTTISTGSRDNMPQYSKTYRIRGIPSTCGGRTAKETLRQVLDLDESSGLEIHSIAPSPYNLGEKVATVTFNGVPKRLSTTGNEWTFKLHGNGSYQDELYHSDVDNLARNRKIVVDTHFEDFTPLNSFKKDEDYKVE